MDNHQIDNIIQELFGQICQPLAVERYEYLIEQLCPVAINIFSAEPTLLDLQSPIKIASDLQGFNLLPVLKYGGFAESNYLFLGNYVDPQGHCLHSRYGELQISKSYFNHSGKGVGELGNCLHTTLLLLAFKIKLPKHFFLLKGKYNVGNSYLWVDEINGHKKNSKNSHRILYDCLNSLPVAALINDKIICTHGGLSPELHHLDQIKQIERTKIPYSPLLLDLLGSHSHNDIFVAKELEFLEKHDLRLICRGRDQGVSEKDFAEHRVVSITSSSQPPNIFMMSVEADNLKCSFLDICPQNSETFWSYQILMPATTPQDFRKERNPYMFDFDLVSLLRNKDPGFQLAKWITNIGSFHLKITNKPENSLGVNPSTSKEKGNNTSVSPGLMELNPGERKSQFLFGSGDSIAQSGSSSGVVNPVDNKTKTTKNSKFEDVAAPMVKSFGGMNIFKFGRSNKTSKPESSQGVNPSKSSTSTAKNRSNSPEIKGGGLERLLNEERERRKELEEDLSKKNEELLVMSLDKSSLQEEIERLRHQVVELSKKNEELQVMSLEKSSLEEEIERLRHQVAEMTPSGANISKFFADFSVMEIKEATNNFHESMVIGEGGYGKAYKGFLQYTKVAIKVPKAGSSQGFKEFNQEVEVLSRLRHPNIVTLIGVCSEASALIYEYVPRGSLEDRLSCKDNSPPLPWKTRIRIARELCCVLIFLQSSKPESIVHGDLKPANVLLDANLSCKLSDFGICRGLMSTANNNTLIYMTAPKGTFAYIDPIFLTTGELTPKSDVYSYGIILLQLLTGKPRMNIRNAVLDAFKKGTLHEMLDASAGEWPLNLAIHLAKVALRCCEMNRRDRPDIGAVWEALTSLGLSKTV